MAKIPIHISEGTLPAHPTAARADPAGQTVGLAAQAQLGAGIAGLGAKGLAFATAQAKEAKKLNKELYDAQQLNITSKANSDMLNTGNDAVIGVKDVTDTATIVPNWMQQSDSNIEQELNGITDPLTRQRTETRLRVTQLQIAADLARVGSKRQLDLDDIAFEKGFQSRQDLLDFEAAEFDIAERWEAGALSPTERENYLKRNTFAAGYDVALEKGYTKANKWIYEKNEDGTFTHGQGLTPAGRDRVANQLFFQKLQDDQRKGLDKIGKQNLENIQIRSSFRDGTFNAAEVDLMGPDLKGSDRKDYVSWWKTELTEAPPTLDPDEYFEAAKTSFRVISGEATAEDAHDALFRSRYETRGIDTENYDELDAFADNEYPKEVGTAMLAGMKKGQGIIGGWYFNKDEKAKMIPFTRSLIQWVDQESKDGVFPTASEIDNKASELAVSVPSPGATEAKEEPRITKRAFNSQTGKTMGWNGKKWLPLD